MATVATGVAIWAVEASTATAFATVARIYGVVIEKEEEQATGDDTDK